MAIVCVRHRNETAKTLQVSVSDYADLWFLLANYKEHDRPFV